MDETNIKREESLEEQNKTEDLIILPLKEAETVSLYLGECTINSIPLSSVKESRIISVSGRTESRMPVALSVVIHLQIKCIYCGEKQSLSYLIETMQEPQELMYK